MKTKILIYLKNNEVIETFAYNQNGPKAIVDDFSDFLEDNSSDERKGLYRLDQTAPNQSGTGDETLIINFEQVASVRTIKVKSKEQ